MDRPRHRQVSSRPWVIIGCGYTGERLARRLLAAGARVVATRRDAAGTAELGRALPELEAHALDLADAAAIAPLIPAGAIVVDTAPPGDDLAAERNLVTAAADAGADRLVYVSSTGVYPHASGDWVDEDTPVAPLGERGGQRLRAETTVLDVAAARGLPAVSLRVSAIYGPGRGVVERLRAGTYRVVGAGDTFVSRIHVDDLVTAIVAAGTIAALPRNVYVVADDEPTTPRFYADRVAERLGLPPPPSVPPEQVSAFARAMLGADRRIRNTRLKTELGVTLAYPTWREGLDQVLAALTGEG